MALYSSMELNTMTKHKYIICLIFAILLQATNVLAEDDFHEVVTITVTIHAVSSHHYFLKVPGYLRYYKGRAPDKRHARGFILQGTDIYIICEKKNGKIYPKWWPGRDPYEILGHEIQHKLHHANPELFGNPDN